MGSKRPGRLRITVRYDLDSPVKLPGRKVRVAITVVVLLVVWKLTGGSTVIPIVP